MPRQVKSIDHMNADSLRYLAENTNITYLAEGSVARALIESSNLEIARVREFMTSTYANVFIDSAQGVYLDLIGDMLGVPRSIEQTAGVSIEDRNIQLSVITGVLGDRFPHPSNQSLGLIPAGLSVQTADSSIKFTTQDSLEFPRSATEVFISVTADQKGTSYNVGKGRIVSHSGPPGVNITNLNPITNGGAEETDKNYKFRLSNSIAGSSTANGVSVKLALLGTPGVSQVVFNEFARGAGTYDAMLVPIGNKVSSRSSSLAQLAAESVSAFGISARVTTPNYVEFKISTHLIPIIGTGSGTKDVGRISAKNAIIDYFETIPLGGEFIVNQLRAAIIQAVGSSIKDIRIIDICFDGRPRPIRNFRLKNNELFTPSIETDSVIVI